MATQTSLPASFVSGNILTAQQQNDLRGAFRILQLFSVQGSTTQISTTTTFVDITGLTVTITPQSATNKILIVSANSLLASGTSAEGGIRFLRGSTTIFDSVQGILDGNTGGSFSSMFLDSPASTSPIIYKAQFNRSTGTGQLYSSIGGTLSNFLVMEISA